jgi:hypothetical protein
MPVIEAQCASILVPHDHRHINQKRICAPTKAMYKHTALEMTARWPTNLGC